MKAVECRLGLAIRPKIYIAIYLEFYTVKILILLIFDIKTYKISK